MKPLEGIKVVEFATFVAMPVAARVLVDWGAEVIKIEAASGDPWRTQGNANNLPIEDDCNPEFAVLNGGKKLISLNLKTPEGKEALLKILEDADIFLTNIRWGAIQRLGLDWDTLHAKFPKLIYGHLTGFGYDGPGKDRPGFDSAAFWAASGLLYEFPEKGSHPMYSPSGTGDVASASSLVGGLMAALYRRTVSGEGARVGTSLYANGIWCNFSRLMGSQDRKDGRTPTAYPMTVEECSWPLTNTYQCKDGRWLLMATVHQGHFEDCMKALGLERCIGDPRFLTEALMFANKSDLHDMIAAAFKTKTRDEWIPILTKYDIVHQPLVSSNDVTKDEQAWANEYLSNVKFPNGEEYILPNSPVTFFGLECGQSQHAGAIGCDTTDILTRYGYTAEQIEDFKKRGIAAGI